MRLGDRVAQATEGRVAPRVAQADPLSRLRDRAREALFATLGGADAETDLDEAELRRRAVEQLERVLADEAMPLTADERDRLVDSIAADILGYGPLQPFLVDDSISEIMVNGLTDIWIEREGRLELTDASFASDDHLRRVIDRIVVAVGRRIDESSPMVDARLPDGSRVNAVIPPLAVDGATLTIRKFRDDFLGIDDYLRLGAVSHDALQLLAEAVRARLNVLVSGGTGSGKTTMLNLLSSFIPGDERIVTIEDAVELRLRQRHVVRYETRPANIEGEGQVTVRDLVRNSLRVRPDRIIVGECRGGETLDMLQAMNTGHDGSLSTLHANSPVDALSRLETMVLMSGIELPMRAIRDQIASAVDLIVQVARLSDGSRRVIDIVEIGDSVDGEILQQRLFGFDRRGIDDDGRIDAELVRTEVESWNADRLEIGRRSLGGVDLVDIADAADSEAGLSSGSLADRLRGAAASAESA